MDIIATDSSDGHGWVDVAACTLPTSERPLRMAEFDDLFRSSLRSIHRVSRTHAQILLAGGADLAEHTQRLADAESACCSFFVFGVTSPAPATVAFDVEVPPAYADVLDGLLRRAEAVTGRDA